MMFVYVCRVFSSFGVSVFLDDGFLGAVAGFVEVLWILVFAFFVGLGSCFVFSFVGGVGGE